VTSDSFSIGIDFGGTKMLGVVVGPGGDVLADHRLPTPYDGEELLDDLVEIFEELDKAVDVEVSGIGIGAAGLVDRDGCLRYGPNVGRLEDLDIHAGLARRRPDLQVAIDNDATCATWSERVLGAGKGVDELVLVTLGTGIGGGFVTDGKIQRGAHGYGGEFGHTTIAAGGLACVCGKFGCWEAYASGRALGRLGREAAAKGNAREVLRTAGAVEDIRGEHVTAVARTGDSQAMAVMDEFAYWLAVGLANVVATNDPYKLVVGGGMAEEADLYLPQAKERLASMLFGARARSETEVVAAELGERAGAIGAALLAQEAFASQ
jgi:glucokinase